MRHLPSCARADKFFDCVRTAPSTMTVGTNAIIVSMLFASLLLSVLMQEEEVKVCSRNVVF